MGRVRGTLWSTSAVNLNPPIDSRVGSRGVRVRGGCLRGWVETDRAGGVGVTNQLSATGTAGPDCLFEEVESQADSIAV